MCGLRVGGAVAPQVVNGAINGELFRGWVERHLVRELRPGDVVVMDNLGSHKVAGVRAAIAAAGTQALYLPPYAPDLNPIELAFSKLKQLVRTAAQRTVAGLEQAIAAASDLLTPTDCRNDFAHCGYTLRTA
ncbi:IS630 family transposase ISMex41 [Planctomycetes bacterium LzC2]|uniref:IS630 family transposase ISMex41 n=1 Tax=Alienimonas chondri TaxID=2681879 RepID=A0ABX1VEM2_9PLAN|nr:transposase [Alienimonas chondri]NNJ26238.1 IS630 family transposase ISMex41 [Alienimonas chondri]